MEVCHGGALVLLGGKAALAMPGACDYCAQCEGVCPEGAILCPFEVVVGSVS